MEISIFQGFWKDSEIAILKMNFSEVVFLEILLIDFRTATNLKTGSSKKYSWKKTSSTKIIHLKVH